MYRNFNLYAFFVKLLPPILRTEGIKAFLWAILKPLDDIIASFNSLVGDADRRLNHNSFTIYLEKFLNGLFGLDGAIYIRDIVDDYSIYLSKKAELMDHDIMTRKSEGLDTLIWPSERPGRLLGRFAVCIPEELDTAEARSLIARWVEYYKFAGTNYTIEVYG